MKNEHRICEIEREVAVLNQKSIDEAKALILAKDIASARWMAILALLGFAMDTILTAIHLFGK